MTAEGWICMILAVATVTALFFWCCSRVVRSPAGTIPSPEEIREDQWRESLRRERRRLNRLVNRQKSRRNGPPRR